MKKVLSIFLLLIPIILAGQYSISLSSPTDQRAQFTSFNSSMTTDPGSGSRFALSFNPLGFVQFGPVINTELGLGDNLMLNAHVRFSSLGLLSYAVRESEERIQGIAFGGGPVVFFGDRNSQPYAGFFIDYERDKVYYRQGTAWENMETEKIIAFIFSGGYRFRFSGGLFMNAGAFFGAARNYWVEEFTDTSIEGDEGVLIQPFGMVDLTFGIEF